LQKYNKRPQGTLLAFFILAAANVA
jgi:hypothetical protein